MSAKTTKNGNCILEFTSTQVIIYNFCGSCGLSSDHVLHSFTTITSRETILWRAWENKRHYIIMSIPYAYIRMGLRSVVQGAHYKLITDLRPWALPTLGKRKSLCIQLVRYFAIVIWRVSIRTVCHKTCYSHVQCFYEFVTPLHLLATVLNREIVKRKEKKTDCMARRLSSAERSICWSSQDSAAPVAFMHSFYRLLRRQ